MAIRRRIKQFWKGIKKKRTILKSAFRILDGNFPEDQKPKFPNFEEGNTYLRIRMMIQFLQNQREYSTTFRAGTISLIECSYNYKWNTFPFILDSNRLNQHFDDENSFGDRVFYKNLPLAGPLPYNEGDVLIFVGLLRIPINKWSELAFNFLESIGRTVGISQLSNIVSISKPIINTIEKILGIEEVELRTGIFQGFQRPDTSNGLKPGYYVQINKEQKKEEEKYYFVKDGYLYFGKDLESAKVYTENDYILYQIECLKDRDDIEQLEFYQTYIESLQVLWNTGNEEAARKIFEKVKPMIRFCPDLTKTHRRDLPKVYKKRFDDEIALMNESKNKGLKPSMKMRKLLLEYSDELDNIKSLVSLLGDSKTKDLIKNIDF